MSGSVSLPNDPSVPIHNQPHAEILQPPPPSWVRHVFTGPDGLRSGWRLALYVLMVVALVILMSLLLRFVHFGPGMLLWRFLAGETVMLIATFVPGFAMARIEKRSFGTYGLPVQPAFGRMFWIGAIWGIVCLSVLLLAMRSNGNFFYGGLAVRGVRIVKFAAFYAFLFLMVGFVEEFLLRGYSLFTLTEGIGFWPAALLLSFLFGAAHLQNKGEAWIGALAAAFIGLFFCLTLQRTGNLWFAVGLHASWDWGETFVYAVPNSGQSAPGGLLRSSFHGSPWITGGTVGPEGSVLVFVLIAVMWLIFDWLYPAVKYPEKKSLPPAGSNT